MKTQDEHYAATASGVLAPIDTLQEKETWTRDDGRQLRSYARRIESKHNLLTTVLCKRCIEQGRQGVTEWSVDEKTGDALLKCACKIRRLQNAF